MIGEIKHIGIQVNEYDLTHFYETLLGCSINRIFELPANEALQIFTMESPVKIIQACFRGLQLELFVSAQAKSASFNHVCLQVSDAAELTRKAKAMGFRVHIRHKLNKPDTYFISDSAYNLFELKNI